MPGAADRVLAPPNRSVGVGLMPGAPGAVSQGCRCSVLANASYRVGAAPEPLLEPDCELHCGDAVRDEANTPGPGL